MSAELPLLPVPSDQWQAEYDRLMHDRWLEGKCNRPRRLREKIDYLARYGQPALGSPPGSLPGVVLDIGPGPGELLEWARHFLHEAIGIDAPSGAGGMGDAYWKLSRLMHQRQNLAVSYDGLQALLDNPGVYLPQGRCVLINSQGSIEQAFAEYMHGEPHDVHHTASRLTWEIDARLRARFTEMFDVFRWALRKGGVIVIWANGARNTDQYMREIESAATRAGGLSLAHREYRLHKWVLSFR